MDNKHFIAPGNVYRRQDGEIIVVSYCWSRTAVDVYIPGKPSFDVIAPDYIRQRCQFIGQNYRLK